MTKKIFSKIVFNIRKSFSNIVFFKYKKIGYYKIFLY